MNPGNLKPDNAPFKSTNFEVKECFFSALRTLIVPRSKLVLNDEMYY